MIQLLIRIVIGNIKKLRYILNQEVNLLIKLIQNNGNGMNKLELIMVQILFWNYQMEKFSWKKDRGTDKRKNSNRIFEKWKNKI